MYNRRNYGITPRTIGGFIEDMFPQGWQRLNEELGMSTIPVNIQENDKGYELHLIAPGLKKEDFKINVDRNILHISYEHKEENKDQQEGKLLRNEYSFRSFKRSFTLNEKINPAGISAKYTDGVLYLTLPKKEPVEPTTQQVTVS